MDQQILYNVCSWIWETETNVLTECFFFFFVNSALVIQNQKHSALETETETNVLTERFFFSFVDSALETEMETFAPGLGIPKHLDAKQILMHEHHQKRREILKLSKLPVEEYLNNQPVTLI
ncbi:hypothetical protein C1645_733360 [Glomus cerebriforme]|uniref:Uncharacterized protein n=1 Tax=Glomus cerebriforme TaxID=658196 RepID=A0A397TDQ6_9GLOM|nr:hypothetical protein C1645_733360 [Glomus cerebriforme]